MLVKSKFTDKGLQSSSIAAGSERERLARFKRIETARLSKRGRYIYCNDPASAVTNSIVLEFFDKELVDRSVLLILVTGIGHNDLGAELLQLLG